MTMELGNGNYAHRSLTPRKQRDLGFEQGPTPRQLDTLHKFVHDERIPAPIAYGIKQYADLGQMTDGMAHDIITMLIDYVNRAGADPVTEPGIYVDKKTGAFYLVKVSQINRFYAMDLVINDAGEKNPDGTWRIRPRFEWVFRNGHDTARKLQASWKATPEQVKQWGDIWSTCIKCFAELTVQKSIDQGMGDTCYGKQF